MSPTKRQFNPAERITRARRALAAFFALIIVSYGLYETRGLIGGPVVRVSEPHDGYITASSTVALKGTAKRTKSISVNGRNIFVDQEGRFNEELLLTPGHTILELEAVDTFQRKTVTRIRIIRTEGQQTTKAVSEPAS